MSTLSSTADDILACARTLIITGGYNGFSYADIAEVVGVRKPSIHHHFPSKVDLVRTLVFQYRKEAEAGLAYLDSTIADPMDRLRNYTAYWEECIANASASFCVCALLAAELPALPAEIALEVRAHFRSLSKWLTSTLEQGSQQGRLQLSGEPGAEGEAFMATVHGAMLSARAYGDPSIFHTITSPLINRLSIRN